ncbi:MAG: PLP-dependent aminotransferase family protein [Acidimicrobiia bacterium]
MPVMESPLSKMVRSLRSSQIRDLLALTQQSGMLSMAGGLPAPETFPMTELAAAAQRVLARGGMTGPPALQYGPTEGAPELRELVAASLGERVDHVLVTTGSQQALDLLARCLCDPGDVIVTADPTYLGALQAFAASGATTVAVSSDGEGLLTDSLEQMLIEGLQPRAVYVVPNFHNPTGVTMSDARRRHLAALADRFGFVIIEDDPYGSIAFDAANGDAGTGDAARLEAPGSMALLTDRCVRVRTTSKVLAPGLRVGWMVGPLWLIAAAVRLKQSVDLHTPGLPQLIASELLQDQAWFSQQLARTREHYRVRADALTNAIDRHLGERVTYTPPRGGMFCWVVAREAGVDATALFRRAVGVGVAFVPGSAFAVDGTSHASAMRLSFATLSPDDLDVATQRLASMWDR